MCHTVCDVTGSLILILQFNSLIPLYNSVIAPHVAHVRLPHVWSGFSWTTIFQSKSEVLFYKKQVISKSTRVIFGFVQLVT